MRELIEKYDELYEDMATAKDPRKMMAFGDAEKWMFHMLAKEHPEIAEKWLTNLEAGKWHNYLAKTEAEEIAVFDFFNVDYILSYLVKVNIVARWALLSPEVGRQMLNRLIKELDAKELVNKQ